MSSTAQSHPVFSESERQSKSGSETVVLIHGLGSHRLLMTPLAMQLKRAGFETRNYGYSSFFGSIERHAARFADYLSQVEKAGVNERWHIVANSLGSIITRRLLCDARFEKLGRVVMLAPPNAGSPAARRLSYLLPLSKTVRQISDDPNSAVNHMPSPEGLDIGIVAASYDFVVSPESIRLATASKYVTVFGGHNGLLVRPAAAKQTISFLKTGEFCE